MPDHTTVHAPLVDRSPVDMPPCWVRSIIQEAALRLGTINARPGNRLMSVGALMDALDALAQGETASAAQAASEAAALRRVGA